MFASSGAAAQLAASQEGLGSMTMLRSTAVFLFIENRVV
jgi:hypothetical protein